MGGGDTPLPVCDRCRHFVVRESGLQTCGPCRKGYQLLVSLRSVVKPEDDEAAVVYLEGCFGLLEDWIGEVKNLEKKEEKKPRGRSKEKKRRRSEDKPLKRQTIKPAPHPLQRQPSQPQNQHQSLPVPQPAAHQCPAGCYLRPRHHQFQYQGQPTGVLHWLRTPRQEHQDPARESRRRPCAVIPKR